MTAGQQVFAWPAPVADTLVVVDASNQVERDLLRQWISDAGGDGVRSVVVDGDAAIADDATAVEQALEDEPAAVVPVRVVWLPEGGLDRTGPRLRDLLLGDPRHPGRRRARWVATRHPERLRYVVGEPATVSDLRARHHQEIASTGSAAGLGDYVIRQAGIALDVAERAIQGRRYKVPRFVAEGVEATPTFARAVAELAEKTNRPRAEVLDEVRGHVDELVTEPNTFFIDWTGKLTHWIVSLGYREIVVDPVALERARDAVRDHPSALLFTHKSHIDAIALLAVLYEHDFPAPHTMAGLNMDFRGVRHSSKRSGIIFIRRSFQDAPAYKVALQQYLGFLMGKRFPFVWAFEGTRSRNGKLMPPRYGMLKYVVDAAHATDATDLHLVPVSINYDLIGEVSEYADQELGRPKRTESLGWFVDYLRRLRSPMGRVYLDFAEPVVVEGPVPAADDADLHGLAFEIARRTNAVVPVTLPALMCLALLGASPVAVTYHQLDQRLRDLLDWIDRRGIRLADGFRGDDHDLTELADLVFDKGLVHRYQDGPDTVFTITEDQQATAGYYRNTIVHYFVHKAIAELALVTVAEVDEPDRVDAFVAEARWLRDLLKFEFFHTPSDRFVAALDDELHAGGGLLAGDSAEREWPALDQLRPLVAHAVLEPYLESYWIVADVFARLGDDATLDESECVARALAAGEQAFLQRRISSRASIGSQMFKGAHALLVHQELSEARPGVTADRQAFADRIADRTGHLDRIRADALGQLGITERR